MTIPSVLAVATIAAFSAGVAAAATVNVTDITAQWKDPDPAGVTISGDALTASWGDPFNGVDQSSYEFTPVPVPLNDISSPFDIGTFTHHNFRIFDDGTLLRSITLDVIVAGNVEGNAFSLTKSFVFNHDETRNQCVTPVGELECSDDIVTVVDEQGSGDSVRAGLWIVSLRLDGFKGTVSPAFFRTTENASNSAILQGSFEAAIVPLPAAGWLLVAGIGGLVALRRRQGRAR